MKLYLASHGYLTAFLSFAVCAMVLPLVRKTAIYFQLHDQPGDLKIHTQPIPRLGGVALMFSIVIGLMASTYGSPFQLILFYLAMAVIWCAGFVDDLFNLPPTVRLLAQLAAGFLLSLTRWNLTLLNHPALDAVLTCLFVAVFVNAFNFLDGSDGLAGGVAALVALGYAVLYNTPTTTVGSAVAWSLLGACLGFLAYNFPPARIFMGDSGSTMLGFLIAFLALDFYHVHHHIGSHWLLPVVFAGLPLMDFLLAIMRRLRNRVSLFTGDRQHFYDILLERGWSSIRVALGAYTVTGTLLVVGWLCIHPDWRISVLLLFVTAALLTISLRSYDALREKSRLEAERSHASHTLPDQKLDFPPRQDLLISRNLHLSNSNHQDPQ
jgi:UDP-GlcNAc:undecaprenyl-phosphate GlcNAc-1-phosphate transferase